MYYFGLAESAERLKKIVLISAIIVVTILIILCWVLL